MGLSQPAATVGAEEGAGWIVAAFMCCLQAVQKKNSGTSTLDAVRIIFYAKHGARLDECA
jgi:hypothetical protein